jgi:Methyltransferase domain
MNNFEQAISNLDIKIFEKIKSQLSENDKQSLLACHLATRELAAGYNYLEIGSYLGGSIQPHLQDEKCAKIYSIDKRPLHQPDNRGVDYTYLNNSTKRMLELLSEVAPVDKISTIDGDTRSISPANIEEKMQLCFIDGEHTDEAVLSDFKFCLEVLDKSGAILFHDAPITYNGIAACVEHLKKSDIKFHAYSLPDIVFAVEIGDFPMHKNPAIFERLTNNHASYLYSLQYNDYYRQFANKKPFLLYRKFLTKWRGLNKFE